MVTMIKMMMMMMKTTGTGTLILPRVRTSTLRCSAPQPGTVYLLRYAPPKCRWGPSSTCGRLSFSSMHENWTVVRRRCDWTASSVPHTNIRTQLNSTTITRYSAHTTNYSTGRLYHMYICINFVVWLWLVNLIIIEWLINLPIIVCVK